MVSALDSGSSGLDSSAGRGHSVVFLGKIRNSHIASLQPEVNCQGNLTKMLGGYLRWTNIPSRRVAITPSQFIPAIGTSDRGTS